MSDIVEKCNVALQALNDWAVTYAPDMCKDETVAAAKERIYEHGTLAYIAIASDDLRSVIAALSEANQRDKDATAWIIPAGGKEYRMLTTKPSGDEGPSLAIIYSALQSEER